MSDEYGSSGSGFGGSLVSESLDPKDAQPTTNNQQDDTTSQGGYGGAGDAFSDRKQRGSDASSQGQLRSGAADKQSDNHAPRTAAGMNESGEGAGLGDALDPSGPGSEAPGSKQFGRREDTFESGPAASMERDAGA